MIYETKTPPQSVLWVTRAFIIRAFLKMFIVPLTPLVELGCMDGLYAITTKWNIILFMVELFNACALVPLFLYGNHTIQPDQDCNPLKEEDSKTCPLILFPVKYALAIALKWIHFVFQLLATEHLGKSVLPAVEAVTGTDAVAFMVFLMLVVLGTVQTYWALPIAENLPKTGRSVFQQVFFRVFRLELLGDFEISELEGKDPRLEGTVNGTKLTGHFVDAKESQLFHDAIIIIVLFACVGVTVLMMNVAIGVVTTAYSENKANSNQLYCNTQAFFSFRFLLQRAAVAQLSRRVFPKFVRDGWHKLFPHRNPIDEENGTHDGYFIGFDGREFLDQNELTEDLEVLQDMITQNGHVLDGMKTRRRVVKNRKR